MSNSVMLGMSGGVDSTVAAYLLQQQGYDVIGATMQLYTGDDIVSASGSCASIEDARDARAVADSLGIPHQILNFAEDFRHQVMRRFIDAYREGKTPNPCIDCNRYLKFGRMLQYAESQGINRIATGHYARIERCGDRYYLKKALDRDKDQTYVLYSLTHHQLAHILLPLGDYRKSEIREIAEANHFVNAKKHDSQDICFVPDGDYAAFIEKATGEQFPEGNFVDLKGNVLGKHKGIVRYTVGQRKGLGIAMGKRTFVCAKDVATNTVTLGDNEDLFSKTLTAHDVNLIVCDSLDTPTRLTAKVRYNQGEQPATAVSIGEGRIRVDFDVPQRAIASGQSVVLYDGDTVVGGGIID